MLGPFHNEDEREAKQSIRAIHEEAFDEDAWSEGRKRAVRTDGREEKEERKEEVRKTGRTFLIRKYIERNQRKVYSTAVVIYVAAEIREPNRETGKRGAFSIHCSDSHIQERVGKVYARLIPLQKLSIVPFRAAWHIRIDALTVSDQGGVFELVVQGVHRMLLEMEMPRTEFCLDGEALFTAPFRFQIPFLYRTVCVAFSGAGTLFDPTEKEKEEAEGWLLLVLDAHREALYCEYAGNVEYSALVRVVKDIGSGLPGS